METAALTPVEEYLFRSYEPDVDFYDGAIIERNVGKRKHSRLQTKIASYIDQRERIWGIQPYTEQRIRVATRTYCVADLCATLVGAPEEDILTEPPLFTIEILSDSDRFADVDAKAQKYLAMGIPHVWTADPDTGVCWSHKVGHSMMAIEDSVLRVPGTSIEIPVGELVKLI